MRDLKSRKPVRVKGNRRKKGKKKRDWKKAFHRVLRLSVALGSVSLIVSGGFLALRILFDSDYFRIDRIRVENEQRVSREEILALSDIEPGQSIFELDLEMIGRKIEENPWIARASVSRVLPRQVVVRVAERVPRAVVSLGYLYYVDGSGEIFKLLGPDDRLDYPLISGLDREFLLQKPAEARQVLREAMELIDELSTRGEFNLEDVSELYCDRTNGFVLYTYVGGVPVRMGFGNFKDKLDRLERVFQELEPRLLALKHIDLNVMERVIVRLDHEAANGQG